MVVQILEYDCTCPTCGKKFVSNHLNRQYCSPKCKNFKNNNKARAIRQKTKDVTAMLQGNRYILSRFQPNTLVSVEQLKSLGFSFSYHTHYQKSSDGATVVCIYDYGYIYTQSKIEVKILKLV
jgi:ribosomal protein S27AE